jgi:hypothetical protein
MSVSRCVSFFSAIIRRAPGAWLLLVAAALGADGYDAPKFDQRLFDPDALSLGSAEAGEIVTALTALVSNFPDEAKVDGDVREKAMAVALGLRPLDGGARAAHLALLAGTQPSRVELLQSLAAVSSALWRHGERLAARSAEPEDWRLAPLLMELSLLVQPGGPQPDRLRAFQRASEAAPLNWNRVVELQRDLHASNQRAMALFRPVAEPGKARPENPPRSDAAPAVTENPGNPPMAAAGSNPEDPPVSEVKRREGAITFIGRDENAKAAVAGVAALAVREPTVDEASLFGLFTDQETRRTFEMRLTYDREGATVTGIDVAERLLRRKYARWPTQLLAELGFKPAADSGESRRVDLALPSLILLGSAFSGEVIADAFAPGGEYALAGGLTDGGGPRLPQRTPAVDLVLAAGRMTAPPKVLFLPTRDEDSSAATNLMEAAMDGEPTVLLRPQVIGFASLEDLRPALLGQAPEDFLAAISDFAAIQALAEKMEIGAIARNEVVRGRLEKVLESWPAHVSARALLDYGARPAEGGMSLPGSAKAIEAALRPVIDSYVARENGEGFVASSAELTDAARVALTNLRLKIDPRAKPYLTAAEDTLEAAKIYLSLTNLGTSIAQQRQRELRERIAAWNGERAKLEVDGVEP